VRKTKGYFFAELAGRALTLSLLFSIVSCGESPSAAMIATKQILHRGLSGEPSTLDPAQSADTFSTQVVLDLYEGLTSEAPSGEAKPALARRWEVDEAGVTYTFHLRPDARWSNGERLRADDFVRAWRRAVDPKTGSPVAEDLAIIRGADDIIAGKQLPSTLGVEAPSDELLVIHLTRPAPFLPGLLTHSSTFPIFSESIAKAHGPEGWVSNGPYTLVQWLPGTSIRLTKNPMYWDQRKVPDSDIEYQFASNETSQYTRFRAGELDVTDVVPSNALAELRQKSPSELHIAPYLATVYYALNLAEPLIGRNVKLRQALSLAIDRQKLVNVFGFGQTPAYGFLPPGVWNYRPQSVAWRELDNASRIAEAKRLYGEAGYSDRHPLRLRVLYNSNVSIKQVAIMIASMWRETLGIDSELTDEEYRVFLQSRHDKARWDVARLGWVADFNDASNFLNALRSHSVNNDSGYSNREFDGLLEEAETTADADARRGLLEKAERVMLDDYPIIPLYHMVSKRLVKPYVMGVNPSPLDRVPSKDLTIAALSR
jgi:oligopeptide transport system substrate-binding protein